MNIISKLDDELVLLEKMGNTLRNIKSGRFDSNINIMNVEEYPNLKFDNSGWDTIAMSPKQLFEISKKFLLQLIQMLKKNLCLMEY